MSRRAAYVVSRAQQTPRAAVAIRWNRLHILNDFALIPDMIAGGKHVGALVEKFVGNAWSYAEAAGGIFGVDHDQVDPPVLDQGFEVFVNDTPSGLAKDITDKKDTQRRFSLGR
jgi:hypothetical protein